MMEILITLALTVIVFTGVGTGIMAGGQIMDKSRTMMNAEALADQVQILVTSDLRVAQPTNDSTVTSPENLFGPDGKEMNGIQSTYNYVNKPSGNDFTPNLIKSANSPAENVASGSVGQNNSPNKIIYRTSTLATVKETGNNSDRGFVTLVDGSSKYANLNPKDGSMGSKLTKYNLVKIDGNGQVDQNAQRGTFHFEVAFDIVDSDGNKIVSRDFKVYPIVDIFDFTTPNAQPTP